MERTVSERAPITVAAFMEAALYHPEHGYYARAAQRSGRAGDFFTSVDVGPVFGELLELQIAEMFSVIRSQSLVPQSPVPESFGLQSPSPQSPLDLVESGAGNGRLSADVLRAACRRHPLLYESIRLHLVEASGAARDQQRAILGDTADRLASSSGTLPESFEGVLVANELLDAMPVHQVVMSDTGLREVFVTAGSGDQRLTTMLADPSTPRLVQYLSNLGIVLEPGWRAEINLNAVDWVRDAARRLRRGFMILIDYGHEARELYSVTHATGTLTSFSGHRSSGPEASRPVWLQHAGEQDITSHVDFTSARAAAEAEGMTTIALLDQTYFLLGIVQCNAELVAGNPQLATLLMPGGLGSTMKVLILGKGVGSPPLQGCSFSRRLT